MMYIAELLDIPEIRNGKDRLSALHDIIGVFSKFSASLRRRQYSRLQLQMQSLASPYDVVLHSISTSSLKIGNFLERKADDEQVMHFETIRDLIAGKEDGLCAFIQMVS